MNFCHSEKQNDFPRVTVLSGGIGSEREVSLASGQALADALDGNFSVDLVDLREAVVPAELNPMETVVFPIVHGTFGEDGTLQGLLESAGFAYAGSDRLASRLCMNKRDAKQKVSETQVLVAPAIYFQDPNEVTVEEILDTIGPDMILKPTDQGSSVALYVLHGEKELAEVLSNLDSGNWMIEKRIFGREVTVGVLNGDAMGVVEVIPQGGVYDYERKYSAGSTEYRFPAVIPVELESQLKDNAQSVFQTCGCRDFARVDFMICEDGHPYFLEVNTLPGMTSTSLLPKSASCSGYDFENLAKQLIQPALDRFLQSASTPQRI